MEPAHPVRQLRRRTRRVQARLDAKFGKPKKAPRDHFLYGKPTVDVEYSKYTNELDVEVSK